jgi:hypothetical protein
MRKTFLKTLVATAVVGATVALGSVFTFAATINQIDASAWTGTYTDKGAVTSSELGSYFTTTGSVTVRVNSDGPYAVELAKKGGGSVSFTAKEDGTARLWLGSSSGSNTTGYVVENATTSSNVKAGSVTGTNSTEAKAANTFSFDIVKGNTYKIYADNSSSSALRIYALTVVDGALSEGLTSTPCGAVYVSGDDVYAIAGVSADKVASAEKVTLKIGKNNSYSSDTVYTELKDGDVTVKASDFGADYLYAIKLTGAKADSNSATFTVTAK